MTVHSGEWARINEQALSLSADLIHVHGRQRVVGDVDRARVGYIIQRLVVACDHPVLDQLLAARRRADVEPGRTVLSHWRRGNSVSASCGATIFFPDTSISAAHLQELYFSPQTAAVNR